MANGSSTAVLGIFTRFDDGHGRPLAEHQAVPLLIEGPRGPGRISCSASTPSLVQPENRGVVRGASAPPQSTMSA